MTSTNKLKDFVFLFLARSSRKKYYLENSTYEISCDTSVLRQVYQNIRYYLYNVIYDATKETDGWIDYNIDGITVINSDVDLIQKYFDENDLKYKITECRKIDDTMYLYGNYERKFRNR